MISKRDHIIATALRDLANKIDKPEYGEVVTVNFELNGIKFRLTIHDATLEGVK